MTRKTAKLLHTERYQSDPDYAQEFDALAEEFSIAEELIRARKNANLTQTALAERMNTTQAQIARMEGGQLPSMRTLERLDAATGTKLHVKLIAAQPLLFGSTGQSTCAKYDNSVVSVNF